MINKAPPRILSARTVASVLDSCGPLASLQQRMRDSQERFDVVRKFLPGALAGQVQAGPVDEAGWSLLTKNAAVAAKLRQLVPRLDKALQEAGWPATVVRIKLLA